MKIAKHSTHSAFTLIELLIVVAIIGILAAIAVPNFLNAQIRAKLASTYASMKSIQTAVAQYQMDNNIPPIDRGPDAQTGETYIALTTPVAYLSSIAVFNDLFHTQSEEDDAIYFAYGGPYHSGQLDDAARIASYKKAGISYFLFGLGPDRQSNWPWPNPEYGLYSLNTPGQAGPNQDGGIFFSPTNGLTSSGDIISTDSRIYQ